jgi:putative transposase
MARALRVEFPGAVYHVTSRGNARQVVFENDSDRREFLEGLQDCAERFRWLFHAYCLMDNHYHLLIETREANLSRGMRRLNGNFTQAFNKTYHRVGHLFQGRYKAILVEKESHLLELCRYVVLNPVRAGLVKKIEDWEWSSFGATAGSSSVPAYLSVDWILARFGRNREAAQEGYRRFVRQGRRSGVPWDGVKGQLFLGGEGFAERVTQATETAQRSKEHSKGQRFAGRPPLSEIIPAAVAKRSFSADAALREAHVKHGYTLREIADFTGMHYTSISKRVKRWEAGRAKE